MASLSDSYNYVISACNDPNIGYSQSRRTTITLGVNYQTYCDCSSLISKALTVGGYLKNNPWFTTATERSYLAKAGWQQVSKTGQWQPGDILWRQGHTEMVYSGGTGKGVTMGAHTDSYAFAKQVSINTYKSGNAAWTELWRDPAGGGVTQTHNWHMSNSYLTDYGDDQTDNAFMVYQFFYNKGFTNAAIAGLLGNMHWESRINPGLWQSLNPDPDNGYGLVQWTPSTKWFNWASAHNIDTTDADESGEGQCQCVFECTSQGEWIPTSAYPYSWTEFSELTDYQEAVKAFMYEYERPGDPHLSDRLTFAQHWYEIIESGVWAGDIGGSSFDLQLKCGLLNDLQRRLVIPGRH